jgi:hypothetical protein
MPDAMAAQNRRRSSRPATGGRPGDHNGGRPDRAECRFPLVIATPSLRLLRRPVEFTLHPPACLGGQTTGEEVIECRTGMSAATLPLADDVVPLGDEVGRAPEVEVGERGAEIRHEGLDVFATIPRLMQRVFQQHVGCGDLIDHVQVAGLAPEVGEPTADDCLVVILQAHASASRLFL